MAQIDLEVLGLTQEQLQERVVEGICGRLLDGKATEDFGEEQADLSPWREQLNKLVQQRIDAKVTEMAEHEVLPKVGEIIDGLVLQQTNAWGERQGKPVSLIEYLVQRAEAYLREQVTHDGKKPDSYGRAVQERIAYMVDRHLHYAIESAMKSALALANGAIAEGIAETVKMKLREIVANIKVAATVK